MVSLFGLVSFLDFLRRPNVIPRLLTGSNMRLAVKDKGYQTNALYNVGRGALCGVAHPQFQVTGSGVRIPGLVLFPSVPQSSDSHLFYCLTS